MHSLNILDDDDAATIQPAKTLPAGALLEGVPAAVAARCEMRGIPARVVAVPAPTGTAGARGFGDGRQTRLCFTDREREGSESVRGSAAASAGRRRVARRSTDAEGVRDGFRGARGRLVGVGASSKPTSAVVDDGMRVYRESRLRLLLQKISRFVTVRSSPGGLALGEPRAVVLADGVEHGPRRPGAVFLADVEHSQQELLLHLEEGSFFTTLQCVSTRIAR